jgi:hypothetical protein
MSLKKTLSCFSFVGQDLWLVCPGGSGGDPIDELCISKSLLLNLPGKEEEPKPGNFPVLLLQEPAGEAKLS